MKLEGGRHSLEHEKGLEHIEEARKSVFLSDLPEGTPLGCHLDLGLERLILDL